MLDRAAADRIARPTILSIEHALGVVAKVSDGLLHVQPRSLGGQFFQMTDDRTDRSVPQRIQLQLTPRCGRRTPFTQRRVAHRP